MKQIVSIILISALLTSCGKNPKKEAESETQSTSAVRDSFFSYLQNPSDVASKLAPVLTGFDAGILNDPTHFIDYTSNDVKAAANLGIYLADLNYCILNKQPSKTKEYFDAVHELSKVLLAEKEALEFLMKRYEDNISQNDSVKMVMEKLLEKSTLGLKGTDRERLAGIAMAGYQLENLHLALATLQSFPENPTEEQIQSRVYLIQFVIQQRGKFVVIHNFIEANSDPLDPDRNPNYPFYNQALRELIGIYQGVTEDAPRIMELHEKVTALRDKIIRTE